jgi:YegS/Rv2252/BmrU family lipid kinase
MFLKKFPYFCLKKQWKFFMSKYKIAFIINPISGRNGVDNIQDTIEQSIDRERFDAVYVQTRRRGEAISLARTFAGEDFDFVVAVGGDGTVNEVAQGILYTNTTLGIVPTGSGNGLAFHLKIPRNIKKAVEIINNAKRYTIDYGLLNERPFFCTCGMGFDAHISAAFAKTKKRGFSSYLKLIVREYFKYKTEEYRLVSENLDMKINAFVITFANAAQWGNNALIAPHANIQDGKLEVTILKKFPVWAIPNLSLQLFSGKIDRTPYIITFETTEAKVIRFADGDYHYDGEPCFLNREVTVKVVPKGLNIIAG